MTACKMKSVSAINSAVFKCRVSLVAKPNKARSVHQRACLRRICRCFRAASNFRSRSAWTCCCRPASMSFGVT